MQRSKDHPFENDIQRKVFAIFGDNIGICLSILPPGTSGDIMVNSILKGATGWRVWDTERYSTFFLEEHRELLKATINWLEKYGEKGGLGYRFSCQNYHKRFHTGKIDKAQVSNFNYKSYLKSYEEHPEMYYINKEK